LENGFVLHVRELAAGFLVSLALVPQELPPGISLKPGEPRYCRATFKDLKGSDFAGVVRATAEGDVTTFEVYLENPTYKAKTDASAFEYAATRRSTITVNGKAIDNGDIIAIDSAVFFVSPEKPAPAEAAKFANDVFLCIAGKKL
jgi:hypothetical protein